jgi:hypothetical protein
MPSVSKIYVINNVRLFTKLQFTIVVFINYELHELNKIPLHNDNIWKYCYRDEFVSREVFTFTR